MKNLFYKIIGYFSERCSKCPSCCWSDKTYDDYDESCYIHKDLTGYCIYSFLPFWVVKIRLWWSFRQEAKFCKKFDDEN